VNNEVIPWTEDGQRRMREALTGPWAEDVWLVTPKSSTCNAVYLRFTIGSISLNLEIKYAVWSRFDSGKLTIGRKQSALRAALGLIIRWLNHFVPPVQSLMEKSLEQWEISLRSFIVRTSRLQHRVRKSLTAAQAYAEYIGEDPRILTFRQLYSHIQAAYDDRPELEKDIWDLRTLGLAVNLTSSHFKLNFTLISQPWLREMTKTYMKYAIALRSPGDCLIKLQATRCFSQFLAQQYPVACISDIDRPMVAKFVSFLRTCDLSDRRRRTVLCSLRVILETCAYQLGIAGLIREPLLFPEDFPRESKGLSREIPEEVLKQIRRHLEKLDTTTMRMVVVLLECGMRISELCTLPLECLIYDDKHDWYLRSCQLKSKQEHIIPLINTKVVSAIQAQQELIRQQWGSACPYLFPKPDAPSLPFKAKGICRQAQ